MWLQQNGIRQGQRTVNEPTWRSPSLSISSPPMTTSTSSSLDFRNLFERRTQSHTHTHTSAPPTRHHPQHHHPNIHTRTHTHHRQPGHLEHPGWPYTSRSTIWTSGGSHVTFASHVLGNSSKAAPTPAPWSHWYSPIRWPRQKGSIIALASCPHVAGNSSVMPWTMATVSTTMWLRPIHKWLGILI